MNWDNEEAGLGVSVLVLGVEGEPGVFAAASGDGGVSLRPSWWWGWEGWLREHCGFLAPPTMEVWKLRGRAVRG